MAYRSDFNAQENIGGEMKKIICPTCKQDMAEPAHPGLNNKDCPQCGQGLSWRLALKKKTSKKAFIKT